jgi:predicted nucleotidyltransferase
VTPDYGRILRLLVEHSVEFIVVGGVAAVLQGVPVTTLDVDLVHRRTKENVDRLLATLVELRAVSRLDARGLRPGVNHLLSAGHQLLQTDAGLLDLLGEISGGEHYDSLIDRAEELDLDGCKIRVLSLEQLLATKIRAGREKDHAAITLIRRTIEERTRLR